MQFPHAGLAAASCALLLHGAAALAAQARNPGLRNPAAPFGITRGMSPAMLTALPGVQHQNDWTIFGQPDPRPNLDIVLVTATAREGACAVDARADGEHFYGQMRSLWRLWSDLSLAYGPPADDPFAGAAAHDVPKLLRSTPERIATVWRRPTSRSLPQALDSVLLYARAGARELWTVRVHFYFGNYADCLRTLKREHARW